MRSAIEPNLAPVLQGFVHKICVYLWTIYQPVLRDAVPEDEAGA